MLRGMEEGRGSGFKATAVEAERPQATDDSHNTAGITPHQFRSQHCHRDTSTADGGVSKTKSLQKFRSDTGRRTGIHTNRHMSENTRFSADKQVRRVRKNARAGGGGCHLS